MAFKRVRKADIELTWREISAGEAKARAEVWDKAWAKVRKDFSVTIDGVKFACFLPSEFEQAEQLQGTEPALLCTLGNTGKTLWWYKDEFFIHTGAQSPEEAKLLLWEQEDKRRRKIERMREGFLSQRGVEQARRERIPEEVRILVWRRDEGQCVRCGRQENLEFDHIIPVSRGGSNTARNVQLLCEACNREKSDKV